MRRLGGLVGGLEERLGNAKHGFFQEGLSVNQQPGGLIEFGRGLTGSPAASK